MKKLLFIIAISVITATSVSAQKSGAASKPITFSLGVEGSLPIGRFGDQHSFGIGGTLQGEYNPDSDFGITLNAGYITYPGKTSNNIKFASINLIPVLAGVKYYLGTGAYVHGQLGAGFTSSKSNGVKYSNTNFMYSPGVGYKFSPNFDAEVKYTGRSAKGSSSSANSIGLRLAYDF